MAIAHFNEVTLVGKLSGEPVFKPLPDGGTLTEWRIVVNRPLDPERRSATHDTINCVSFTDDLVEIAADWQDGDHLALRGALRRHFWFSARTASKASRYAVEVHEAETLIPPESPTTPEVPAPRTPAKAPTSKPSPARSSPGSKAPAPHKASTVPTQGASTVPTQGVPPQAQVTQEAPITPKAQPITFQEPSAVPNSRASQGPPVSKSRGTQDVPSTPKGGSMREPPANPKGRPSPRALATSTSRATREASAASTTQATQQAPLIERPQSPDRRSSDP